MSSPLIKKRKVNTIMDEEQKLQRILKLRDCLLNIPIDAINSEDRKLLRLLNHHSLTIQWLREINNINNKSNSWKYDTNHY